VSGTADKPIGLLPGGISSVFKKKILTPANHVYISMANIKGPIISSWYHTDMSKSKPVKHKLKAPKHDPLKINEDTGWQNVRSAARSTINTHARMRAVTFDADETAVDRFPELLAQTVTRLRGKSYVESDKPVTITLDWELLQPAGDASHNGRRENLIKFEKSLSDAVNKSDLKGIKNKTKITKKWTIDVFYARGVPKRTSYTLS
jgi:hypothetical protein